MTPGTVIMHRLLRSGLAATVASAGLAGAVGADVSLDPDLLATLELRDGFIEYKLEPGTLHFFDEENQPLAVQVIDACTLNDHYWFYGAGLSGISIQLNLRDLQTGNEVRPKLPAYEPGKPIGTVLEPKALPICSDDAQVGGLPRLDATAVFTGADAGSGDTVGDISLLSDGADRTYRRLVQGHEAYRIVTRGSPVAAVDTSDQFDRLYLFTEGRTPRSVEGVVFTGDEGMLPPRAQLEKALRSIARARVRRAFEAAKGGKVPRGIIEDLGLRKVQRVHHADLDFHSLGSEAYLAMAGWIAQGKVPLEPPALVEERFTVELVSADGSRVALPLTGPFVGSDQAGHLWQHGTADTLVQIADQCALTRTFWTWAGTRIDEPLELVITDTMAGGSATPLEWTDRGDVALLSDTASLTTCP